MGHWREEVIYIGGDIPKIFFYKQVKKSCAQVITAQGAKCQDIVIVELNVRFREFEKLWLFHVLANLEYLCIFGVDFISGSNIILDFDRKSLAIPDSQIETVLKTIVEGKVEIDLCKTKLEENKKQEVPDLFKSFQELFSGRHGLTHVLYHEIDTGYKPPVVSLRIVTTGKTSYTRLSCRQNIERGNHNSDAIPVHDTSCFMYKK
ncbi:uncharacterized protein TNCV_3130771 [Trichonephila clavipes]|nr:uncharacterized protein TNCV_3130771 [Trichonephila clavipes]